MQLPGWRLFLLPAFLKTRVFFFLTSVNNALKDSSCKLLPCVTNIDILPSRGSHDCIISYEMRENNHTHSTAMSVHSSKLTVTTKHFWGKNIYKAKPTLCIKLDIKITFWHTCLNLGMWEESISPTSFHGPCLPNRWVSSVVLNSIMIELTGVMLTFRLT